LGPSLLDSGQCDRSMLDAALLLFVARKQAMLANALQVVQVYEVEELDGLEGWGECHRFVPP
jgi:hypothetical protein